MKTKNCWNCQHNTTGEVFNDSTPDEKTIFGCSIKGEGEDRGQTCDSYLLSVHDALINLKNGYDAYYFENKYGDNTYKTEFDILTKHFENDELGKRALSWIRNNYDCHYKDDYDSNHENSQNNPFSYLTARLNGKDDSK